MKLHFVAPNYIEPWDWRAIHKGIGGSETSHIELAKRFAARGYEVVSYTKLPEGQCSYFEDVHWRDLSDLDLSDDGLFIVYRDLKIMDGFTPSSSRSAWLVCQDVDYASWTPERADKFSLIMGLCRAHVSYLQSRHAESAHKIVLSGNGIPADEILKSTITEKRNPKRLIYSSSPDRGLIPLSKIFERAVESVPELELHIFYGLDNIEKLCKTAIDRAYWKPTFDVVEKLQQMPNVHWHGRVGQPELRSEIAKSGLWCYPTNFTETSCITSMEMQALGAIPITRPLWGLADNVQYGCFIDGDINDKLVLSRYVDAVVRMASNPEGQEAIRKPMMQHALARFNWERIADQWESWILPIERPLDFARPPGCMSQMAFQHRYSTGKILNIGCNDDNGGFRFRDCVNVDIQTVDSVTGKVIPVDVLADARALPDDLHGKFDTVILGDILEHMTDDDAVLCLEQAALCLTGGGKIIVTVPEDHRDHSPDGSRTTWEYAPGVKNWHSRPIDVSVASSWFAKANLAIERCTRYDALPHFVGWGFMCKPITTRNQSLDERHQRWRESLPV